MAKKDHRTASTHVGMVLDLLIARGEAIDVRYAADLAQALESPDPATAVYEIYDRIRLENREKRQVFENKRQKKVAAE